jgi:hypothetical protein
MKKSTGKPSRIKGPENRIQVLSEPAKKEVNSRKWVYPVAAVTVLIIILMIIFPCSRRHNNEDRTGKRSMIRWIEWGICSSGIEKKPPLSKKRPAHAARIITSTKKELKKEHKESSSIKSAEEKKIIDFGTKLELVPPPDSH